MAVTDRQPGIPFRFIKKVFVTADGQLVATCQQLPCNPYHVAANAFRLPFHQLTIPAEHSHLTCRVVSQYCTLHKRTVHHEISGFDLSKRHLVLVLFYPGFTGRPFTVGLMDLPWSQRLSGYVAEIVILWLRV